MGWTYGCAVIEFDFHTAIEELLEPEVRQFIIGNETPEELRAKAQIDAGIVALLALGMTCAAVDAPVSFSDASRRDFDNYAVGTIHGKTVLVGMPFGLDQDSSLLAAYTNVSAKYGPVYAFWFDDTSGTYMLSVFREGKRIRFFTTGPGLNDDEGARVSGEPAGEEHGHDHLLGVLLGVTGQTFSDLLDVSLERFASY